MGPERFLRHVRFPDHGFGGADVITTLVAGVLLLVAFGYVESRADAPLVSLPMLRRPTVAWGNLGGLVTFSMMSTVVFVLTLYLQETLGLSAFETGLVFGVQGVLSAVAGVYAPKVVGRFGARRTLVGSLAGQGLFVGSLVPLNAHPWSVWPATAAIALASMCHLGAIISYGLTVTSGVPDDEQGLATGLVTSTQQVGITVGIPLLGVLATTSPDLLAGVHTVLALDAVIVLAAAVLVAAGLRRGGSGAVQPQPLGLRQTGDDAVVRVLDELPDQTVRELAVRRHRVPVALVHVIAGDDQPGVLAAQPDRVLRGALEVDRQRARVQGREREELAQHLEDRGLRVEGELLDGRVEGEAERA